MHCCTNCFSDIELVGFIHTNFIENGTCDYCESSNVPLLNPREFEEKFISLTNIYESIADQDREDLTPDLFPIKIQDDWSIFSEDLDSKSRLALLKEILSGSFDDDHELFTQNYELKVLLHDLEEADTLEEEWELFADEIKTKNRFFLSESIDLDLLEDLFNIHTKGYKEGKRFFRGRISKEEGYKPEKMGKPPASYSKSGRANPIGIPYLYVSTSPKTVLHESRATHTDFITIAEFKLLDGLKVLRLRKVDDLSPFMAEDGLENYLKYRRYLKRLEQELSKPLRRHDDEQLDYLPTQYLCEYVKSLGFDAIEYGSSIFDGGVNLAIFDDSKLEIVDVKIFEVTSVELKTTPDL